MKFDERWWLPIALILIIACIAFSVLSRPEGVPYWKQVRGATLLVVPFESDKINIDNEGEW